MSVLKRIERAAKVLLYRGVFQPLFRNAPVSLPLNRASIKRVLLIRRDMIGDMIIASSGIRYFTELLPDAKIDVFCAPKGKVILEHNPRVTTVYSARLESVWETLREAMRARQQRYDLILALTFKRTTQDGFWANLISRTAVKAAIEIPKSASFHRTLFNALVDIGTPLHQAQRDKPTPLFWNLHQFISKLFGVMPDELRITQEIFISDAEKKLAEDFLVAQEASDFIVFNVSARLREKEWGIENNRRFLRLLTAAHPELPVLISSDPAEIELAELLVKEYHDRPVENRVQRITPMPLRALAHLLSKAKLLVSPDTALVHIAATFGVPVVMMCTGKHSGEEFEPHGQHIAVWAKDAAPIETVTPEAVLSAANTLLTQVNASASQTVPTALTP